MIPDSLIARHAVYGAAVLQTAVAPLAFVYFVSFIATGQRLFTIASPAIDTFLQYWLGCELIFYVFIQITRNRMQTSGQPVVYPDAKGRRDLYFNCLQNIGNVEEWLSAWFKRVNNPAQPVTFHEICRENLAEWLSWAFFSQPLEKVLEDEAYTKELYWMVDHFERERNVKFKEGYDDDIAAYRLTIDPLQAYHRPLAFYVVIYALSLIVSLILQLWGMKRYGPEVQPSWWDPPVEHDMERVSYWFRDGDRSKKPIVFVHGIGPGLLLYLKFVYQLLCLDAPMFCIELPYVSMRCVEDVPTMQETVIDMERMLHRHDFEQAVFVGHSLGTGIVSWVCKQIPGSVSSVVFLDPICFMLHYRDICYNFVYLVPKTAGESILKFFASSELYVAYYISRHFHWFQMALYVSPPSRHSRSKGFHSVTTPMPRATKVFLSGSDTIVNSPLVLDYLTRNGVESEVMDGMDHGWFLFKKAWQAPILEAISQYIHL